MRSMFMSGIRNTLYCTKYRYIFLDFCRIHMWLVWILSAGARHFIEILPMSLLDKELNYNLEHRIG